MLRRKHPEEVPALELGVTSAGRSFVLPLGWHALIAGLSGSGKSTTLRAALTAAAHEPDLAVVLIDVKRVESRPWRPRAAEVAVTPVEALDVLERLVVELDRRYALLDTARAVMWSTRFGPRVLLVVDELAGIIATGDRTDKRAAGLLRQLLERGRAAGYTIVLATQRPSADVIPTNVRDLCALRIAHATANVESTRMILADAADLGPAHRLPIDDQHRGQAWAVVDGARVPQLVRSYFVTPEQAEAVARRTAHLNVAPWPAPAQVDANESRATVLVGAGLHANESRAWAGHPARTSTSAPRPAYGAPDAWAAPSSAPVAYTPTTGPLEPAGVILDAIGPSGATTNQLAALVGMNRADLTAVCARLVAAGRLTRGRDNRWRHT